MLLLFVLVETFSPMSARGVIAVVLLLQNLVAIWSRGEETSRVLAFLSINSLTHKLQDTLLEYIIKVITGLN